MTPLNIRQDSGIANPAASRRPKMNSTPETTTAFSPWRGNARITQRPEHGLSMSRHEQLAAAREHKNRAHSQARNQDTNPVILL